MRLRSGGQYGAAQKPSMWLRMSATSTWAGGEAWDGAGAKRRAAQPCSVRLRWGTA